MFLDLNEPVFSRAIFGKGTIQRIYNLRDGSALYLTIEEYFVGPHKKKIHGVGVIPDIEVKPRKLSKKDEEKLRSSRRPLPELDNQLKVALEFLRSKGRLR